ncbi:MAG TPA: hypothetical protein VEV41_05185 [Terriglobales bacterium]|jgi:uncharacterized membrane protein|nr:hypothetical protein [Terriglobales bacterium]
MNSRKSQWIGLGVALGAGIGAALGVATHQMGAWLPIGTGVGIAIASALAERKSEAGRSPRTQKTVSSRS